MFVYLVLERCKKKETITEPRTPWSDGQAGASRAAQGNSIRYNITTKSSTLERGGDGGGGGV